VMGAGGPIAFAVDPFGGMGSLCAAAGDIVTGFFVGGLPRFRLPGFAASASTGEGTGGETWGYKAQMCRSRLPCSRDGDVNSALVILVVNPAGFV
jgi:hypothetical protein